MGLKAICDLLDESSELICFFDDKGKITHVNRAVYNELDFDNMNFNIRDILPNLFTEEVDIVSYVRENVSEDIRSDVYRKNHTCFPVNVHFYYNDTDAYSDDLKMAVFITDYREVDSLSKRLNSHEENMKEVLRSKDEFTANLTHELRTPVNGIRGHIRNLYEKEEDISAKRTLNIVLDCCDNMEKIIDNLLDYAKLENGKMVVESEPFSLRELINTSVNTLESVANEKGIELRSSISEDIPDTVYGDEFHLSQVINNLLNNAIKFTSSGYVSIDVYKTKHKKKDIELTFFVTDTGIGMSVEDMDKIFNSFSQVDGSITRKYGGTGLGLYVCKKLVELMGGHIEVESEKGKGSTFTFNINMLCDDESDGGEEVVNIFELKKTLNLGREEQIESRLDFANPDNISKINGMIEKCKLCVELDNWDKAEGFASGIKALSENAPKEVSSIAFRLVMNVRKEKKEKCRDYLDELEGLITSTIKAGENNG